MVMLALDHPVWEALRLHIVAHLTEYISLVSLLVIAFICTMPEMFPKTWQDWWSWLRNGLQTATPAARAQSHASSQIVTQTPTTTKVETTASSTEPPKTETP
jgi:hypothetical protein